MRVRVGAIDGLVLDVHPQQDVHALQDVHAHEDQTKGA